VVQETEADIRAPQPDLLALVTDVFAACGMSGDDASLLADSLVLADLEGVHSHGILRVPEYVKKLTVDGVNPAGRPRVIRDAGAAVVVDGGNSMGQIGMTFAMDRAIDRAATTGIAAAAVRGSNHSGAMSYYVRRAAARGMIGIATTNALPTMAPVGGAERIVGINPLGLGVPAGREHPIIYDAAFGATAHGKIRVYAQKRLPIPAGWALDVEGQPTTDAVKAIDGLIQPVGAYKGIGIAMVMGIMSSMLSGAAYGTELGDLYRGPEPGMDGHFVAAINVASFEDLDRFKARVDRAIQEIHETRKAPGVEQTYVPGEIESEKRERYLRTGIPLNEVSLRDLKDTAGKLEVSVASYRWLPD
jgi:LDH2 family malate/lactate/ureidoglycolate dehydrogenase